MELKDILLINLKEITSDQVQNVLNVLSSIAIESIPKKQMKKAFEVAQGLLKLKAEEVESLRARVPSEPDDNNLEEMNSLHEENEKLKKVINKLDIDKAALKTRIKDLADDMNALRKRLDASNVSDKDDSSDILSEIDRREELLKNINAKNKHIKRLLRDIESLEKKTIEQTQTISLLTEKLNKLEREISQINDKYTNVNDENCHLNDLLNKANEEIDHYEEVIQKIENERERTDREFKTFVDKLEEKAYAWRKILDDKESQLDSMRKKYEELYLKHPNDNLEAGTAAEVKNLVEAVQERDHVITELESKLRILAGEMMSSTQLMNQISQERESVESKAPTKSKACCEDLQVALEHANKRCRDLSEMLDSIEEDNLLKSKQAYEAFEALKAYEMGKDGLPQSLQKIGHLQQKLSSRDKQIKALVMEINSLHEIAQENLLLRKKFNIPEDAVLFTSNLSAKQKSKDKLINRLSLKLRASEEIRLNLKLEMNELRKELSCLKNNPRADRNPENVVDGNEKYRRVSEPIYCTNCLKLMKSIPDKNDVIQEVKSEWESKYASVIEENENLRVGMHEILERIREYDASSDHITIDCTILERVLHALDARSVSGWYHPAMRMQNELIALKEREQALKEQINIVERAAIKQISSEEENDTVCADTNGRSPEKTASVANDNSKEVVVIDEKKENEKPTIIDSSQSLFPIIVQKDIQYDFLREKLFDVSEKYRNVSLENEKLKCFEALYEEIKGTLGASDSQITQYCAVLVDKTSTAETKLIHCEKKYQFLREDYDRTVNELNNMRMSNTAVVAELKNQIINKSVINVKKADKIISNEEGYLENESLKKENAMLKIQLAHLTNLIIKESMDHKKLDELNSFAKYGIITEDFHLDYITCQEYDKLHSEHTALSKSIEQSMQQCKHLEKLLAVAEEQIKSQQKQLTDLTDNQVNLRHLVADLQSSNEERFIIAKSYRDIEMAREEISKIKQEKKELEIQCNNLRSALKDSQQQNGLLEKKCVDAHANTAAKFLKKSLFLLQGKYCKYTPLVMLSDFLAAYAAFFKSSNGMQPKPSIDESKYIVQEIIATFKLDAPGSETENIIKAIKCEAKCKLLEDQNNVLTSRAEQLESDLRELKLSCAADTEHWNTIHALFSESPDISKITVDTKTTQCEFDTADASTNTIASSDIKPDSIEDAHLGIKTTDVALSCPSSPSIQYSKVIAVRSLESQLKQAMNLASTRNALLLESENKLAESQGRIKEMERIIEEKNTLIRREMEKVSASNESHFSRRSSLVESTITSLQALLTEKDVTLGHYQELLKTEREQHAKSCENYEKELEAMQLKCIDAENKSKTKAAEIAELTSRLNSFERRATTAQLDTQDEMKQLEDSDNNFNEISDEKIEEMFLDDNKQLSQELLQGPSSLEMSDEPLNRYIHQLQTRLREADEREKFWEKNTKTKDEEIDVLKEKLALLEEREKIELKSAPESEQLQALLEEKDKHINDLLETLSSFHDDQQCFINETSLYSADQVTQLGADLTRSETTNRILSAQLEALRRQVSTLTMREKQARELANSLRNQLIKRPVVSVKSELNTRAKQEQLQKRLQMLEAELEDLRNENKRMAGLLKERRAKNANDIALWDKQKRWQQNAEKLKAKLTETETNLEKTRLMLNAAKTTVNRLEKEKNSLEARLRGGNSIKCCRTPSCPNLLAKYCPSESPETCTTASECNTPEHREHPNKMKFLDVTETRAGIINALKARIESQQRKIVALELERKGSNALTTELEKSQEKLASVEAQNIRLEAKNLQLQLDIDLLKQGDEKERLHKRIKYLEDYVLALKEELAHFEARRDVSAADRKFGASSTSLTHPEQTILSLRRIVEKLRVENKHLREIRSSFEMRDVKGGGDLAQELQTVNEKLRQKTQLLEKAKILLTRAAAKEKNLKEQLTIWKRKCSELQNVPVIDEISE